MNIRDWLEQLRTHSYNSTPEIVLCGNKVDLFEKRVISEERARREAEKLGLPYFETSAATGQNVAKAVETLLDMVMNRMQQVMEDTVLIKNSNNLKLTDTDENTHNYYYDRLRQCYC